MNSTTDPAPTERDKRIEQLLEAYWGISGHNRAEKLPLYVEAIEAHYKAKFEKLIGADETWEVFRRDTKESFTPQQNDARNRLRAQLRAKLKEEL